MSDTDDDSSVVAVVICTQVLHRGISDGAVQRPCCDCGANAWVGPAALKHVNNGADVLCTTCALVKALADQAFYDELVLFDLVDDDDESAV